MSLPIYGSPFTLGMIDHKRERGLQKHAELRPVHDGDRIDIGPFDYEFLDDLDPPGNITAFHLAGRDPALERRPTSPRSTGAAPTSAISAPRPDPSIRNDG